MLAGDIPVKYYQKDTPYTLLDFRPSEKMVSVRNIYHPYTAYSKPTDELIQAFIRCFQDTLRDVGSQQVLGDVGSQQVVVFNIENIENINKFAQTANVHDMSCALTELIKIRRQRGLKLYLHWTYLPGCERFVWSAFPE